MKFFVLTFVVLCFTATCLAQDKIVISHDPPPAAAIFPLVREVGNAQVLENPRKNETIARTKSQRVYGQDMEGLSLAAEFASNGKKVVEPKTVTLKIYYMGKDHSFVENRTIKIYVDEKELISGTSIFIRANEKQRITCSFREGHFLSGFQEGQPIKERDNADRAGAISSDRHRDPGVQRLNTNY